MREMPASVPISLISHSYRFTEEQVGGGGASVSKQETNSEEKKCLENCLENCLEIKF